MNAPTEIVNRDIEKWRRPLIAFYERDELPAKAALLKAGEPFDHLDRRAIRALEAAVICAMVSA